MFRASIIVLMFTVGSVLCQNSEPYCEPQFNKCWVHINTPISWNDAVRYCSNIGPNTNNVGTLTTIPDRFQNNALTQHFSNDVFSTDPNPYIGAFELAGHGFQWIDGSPFNFANWFPGQPIGHCAQLCLVDDPADVCVKGQWRAVECRETSGFICEYAMNPGTGTGASTTTSSWTPWTPPQAVFERSRTMRKRVPVL